MKKFLLGLLIAATAVLPLKASADSRVMVYYGQNPDVNEQNSSAARQQRLKDGTILRDILGPLATTGAYSNLQINPVSGSLKVTVGLSTAGQLGFVYQLGADDTSALPAAHSTESLAADSTQIVNTAEQNSTSPQIGTFTAPGGSEYKVYVVEAQLSTTDTTDCVVTCSIPSSLPFISTTGSVTYNSYNWVRNDAITYQIGTTTNGPTSGTCPATFNGPSPDSGWIQIGYVCVSTGQTTIPSGQIEMASATSFVGGTFGTVTFGGAAAVAGTGGVQPSTLATHVFSGCGQGNLEGFDIQNAGTNNSGNHIAIADLSGDLAACGNVLFINAQGGGTSPCPYPNISNSGGAANACGAQIGGNDENANNFHLYPQNGATTITFHCAAGPGVCVVTGGTQFLCQNNYNATNNNNAMVSLDTTSSGGQAVIAQTYYSAGSPQNGVQLNLYNMGTAAISPETMHYTYLCF